jgi:CBS domain containing-hemolysin-like protein
MAQSSSSLKAERLLIMTVGLHISLIIVLMIVLVFLSTIQSAVNELSEVQLRVLLAEHEGGFRSRLWKELVEAGPRFLLALGFSGQILIVFITILVSTLFGHWEATRTHALLWALLVMLGVISLFRQLVPQLLVQRDPARVLLFMLPALSIIYRGLQALVYPIYRVIEFQQERLQLAAEKTEVVEDEDTDEEIQAFIDVGEEEGIIEEAEGQLIQSIVELGDRRVAEIMTPRSEIVAVSRDTPVRQALNTAIEAKSSRLPVYRDQLDNIEGVVYLRDLLKCWQAGRENDPVGTMTRTAYFVPETKSAGDLLEEMRTSHTHIALVIDEFGGIAGLITIEGLLEEIVGGIQEEDRAGQEEDIITQPDGSYLVNGSTEIRRIEEMFETEIEADDFTTVAGLVIRELKHLPAVGEQLHFKHLLFEVVEADSRRIRKIRVRPLPSDWNESQQLAS